MTLLVRQRGFQLRDLFLLLQRCAGVCLVAGLGVACSPDALDPTTLPYRLEKIQDLGPEVYPADLDGDGRDELAFTYTPSQGPDGVHAVWIRTQDGQTIDQVNYEGQILPLHFLDVTGDARPEILVPYVRNDSLFLSVLNGEGQQQFGFFLIDGEPRQEPNSTLPWDPSVREFHVTDVDADGDDELVTVVFTAFAQLPRGLLIHDLPDGRPVGRNIVGAAPADSYLGDFDGDGVPEIVMSTFAPNNGAKAGGFDDQHTYLIAFELGLTPEVTWSKTVAEKWSGVNLAYDDFDGDGRREFLSMSTSASATPQQAQFELIEPGTWRTLRRRTVSEPLEWATPVDLNRDTRPEIIAVRGQNELWALNHEFQRTYRRTFDHTLAHIEVWPDVDGDDIDEIVAHTPWSKTILLLGPDFQTKAAFIADAGSRVWVQGIMRRGLGTTSHLIIDYIDDNHRTASLRLVENRFYWFYRYGPPVLWGMGGLVVLGLVAGGRRLYRRNRLLGRLHTVAFDAVQEGIMVLDAKGTIVWINSVLQEGLGSAPGTPIKGRPFEAGLDGPPGLTSLLRRALATRPPRHHEDTLMLAIDDSPGAWHVAVEPIPGEEHWLVVCRRGPSPDAPVNAKTWAMMARKVTHDIKNPLTNILLTTQRLQSEYRERAPDDADALDAYAERIVDRVSHLRELTKHFMKILDIDALDVVKTDPGRLLRDVADDVRPDLPPDIDLGLDVGANLPAVWMDREQIRNALENLVANAIRALSRGGTITLSAYAAPGLRTTHTDFAPADFVVIEVQDNGVGIVPENRAHLFEPGFTTSEFGTGLGLALVKHVVEHHRGFIEVESEPGVGSIFTIHLPVANPTAT